MSATVVLSAAGRRIASVLLVLCVALLCASPRAAAHHIAGATYSGTHAGGGTVEFAVSADGSSITYFKVTNVPASNGCHFDENRKDYPQGLPITNHAFDDSTTNYHGHGEFNAPQQAGGTFRITTPPGYMTPGCDSGDVSWTASTTAQPPPDNPPGGGDTSGGGDQSGGSINTPSGQTTVSLASSLKLSIALSNGLTVLVRCPGACSVVSELLLSGSTAKTVGLAAKSIVVARGTAKRSQRGTAKVKVKFKSKAKRKLRGLSKVKLKLRTKVKDATGKTRTITKTLTLRRSLPKNRPPSFPRPVNTTASTQFQYDPATGYLTGATTTLTINSLPTDPDGDPLTYTWTATNGSISGNGPSATWEREISFGQPADGDATATVRDGRGGSDSFTFRFS